MKQIKLTVIAAILTISVTVNAWVGQSKSCIEKEFGKPIKFENGNFVYRGTWGSNLVLVVHYDLRKDIADKVIIFNSKTKLTLQDFRCIVIYGCDTKLADWQLLKDDDKVQMMECKRVGVVALFVKEKGMIIEASKSLLKH